MATGKALDGKSYTENPHVWLDERERASMTTPWRGSLRYIALLLVTGTMLDAWADTYTLSPDRTSYSGMVQAGAAVSTRSDTCAINVPDGMYATVRIRDDGYRWHHCKSASFRVYLNGSRLSDIFDSSIELTSSGTMNFQATVTGDSYRDPYVISHYGSVAGASFPIYTYRDYPYTDYYYIQNYSVYVSYVKKLPDLSVSSISLSEDAISVNENVRLTFTVRNGGRLATGNASIARVYDGTRQIGGDLSIGVLAPGSSSAHTVELPQLAAGTHGIRVVVDAAGRVEESNEKNNEATASLRVYTRTAVGVTFDLNGGGKSATVSIVAGDVITSPPSVERVGYDFLGWWTSATGGSEISANEKITQPRTFYARWKPHTTSISFNRRGGSGGTRTVTATYDAALPAITVPNRTGYDFGGYWTGLGDGGVQVYSAAGTGLLSWSIDQSEATLLAKWNGRTVTLTLDRQGGMGGESSATATYGEVPPGVSVPVLTGWRFQGYFTNPGGEGVRYYAADGTGVGSIAEPGGVTLYAHWLPVNMECDLVFDLQGGTGATSVKATYGQVIPDVTVPVRAGYAFGGYFTEPDGGGKQYCNADGTGAVLWEGVEPVTLYAKWEKAYRVVLDPNGGEGERKVHYFTKPEWELAANTFTSNGCVFAGWALGPYGVPIYPDEAVLSRELLGYGDDPDAEPVTLYAAWGRPLTTDLFPEFTFVTGGTGEDGGWLVEDGELRRGHTGGGASWLSTTFDGFGELSYSCTNIYFLMFNARDIIRNNSNVKNDNDVSVLGGKHLAVWYFPGSASYADKDENELKALLADKKVYAEEKEKALCDWIVRLLTDVYGNNTYEYEWRRLMTEIYEQRLDGWLRYVITDRFYRNGYKSSQLDKVIAYYKENNSDRYTEYAHLCSEIEEAWADIGHINSRLLIVGKLHDISWTLGILVAFAESTNVDTATLYAALDKKERIRWEYEKYIETVCDTVMPFMTATLDYGEDKEAAKENWRKIITQCMMDVVNGTVESYWNGSLMSYIRDTLGPQKYHYNVHELRQNYANQGVTYRVAANAQILLNQINELESFVANCGVMARRIVVAGEVIGSLPAPKSRDGFTFDGWFDEMGTKISEDTKVTEDMIVHARWSINKYLITFDANGGMEVAAQTVEHGERIALPSAPTREGYVFEGWYCDVYGNIAAVENVTAMSDMTFYARWTEERQPHDIGMAPSTHFNWDAYSCLSDSTSLVTFDANEGMMDCACNVQVGKGKTIGELPVSTRSGYAFIGWYTAKSGGTKVTAETIVTDDMTLYAHWTAAWTVTLNANGGTVDSQGAASPTVKLSVAKGKAVGTLPTPAKAGYAFKGWYTKKSGGTKITTKTKVTKSITWYAQWTVKKYKVVVKKVGKGTVSGAGSKAYKSKVTLKAKAASGHVFLGWYLDDVLKSQKTSYTVTVPLDGVTYTAKFITKAEDKAGIGMEFGGVGFGAMADGGGLGETALPVITNTCGVVTTWPVSASGLTAVSVSVSGQSKGMKYDAKKKAVTGVPSVANKSGTMKITVKSAGASRTWSVKWRTVALPAFARGTFNGWTYEQMEKAVRKVTVSVTSAGKITVKAGALSFAQTGWTVGEDGFYRATLSRTRTVGTGKKAKKYKDVMTLVLAPEAAWTEDQLTGTVKTFPSTNLETPTNADTELSARRNPFGDNAEAKDMAAQLNALGEKQVTDGDGLVWNVKVSANGVATISRTTGSGKKKKTVSATAVVEVVPAEGDGYLAMARFLVNGKVLVASWP